MKQSVWMPVYIGDYLGDTIGLDFAQHGAYFLAMMAYWRKGGPLTEDEANEIMRAHCGRIAKFFRIDNGLWHHKRIDEELVLAKNRSNQSKSNAIKRWRGKSESQTKCNGNAAAMPPQCSSPSPSPIERVREKVVVNLRRPQSLQEVLEKAQFIGMSADDAKRWFMDCEVAEWRRGDGTLFDNWPKQMIIHRDKIRETGFKNKTIARKEQPI